MTSPRPVGWEQAPERAHLMVRHVTELYYGAHAEEAHSEVRKSPVDTGLQRVLTGNLHVEPQALRFARLGVFSPVFPKVTS